MSKKIVIASPVRTAIGAFSGGLSTVPATELGAHVIKETLTRSNITPEQVDDVVMGHVLTAGLGQNTARQAAINAGISAERTALTINQVCGSGLRSVALGMQAIANDDADIVVAGGMENMSLSPHVMHMRSGTKMGNASMIDSMVNDGLWDAFNDYHMGITAENLAEKYQLSRDDQDAFAANSQQLAEKAMNEGRFDDEIVGVEVQSRKETVTVARDENPRAGTTAESLGKLRPAFKKDGTVTAGNASSINDGAAAVTLLSEEKADALGVESFGRIVSWATAGVDPSLMGIGPVPATRKALERAGWTLGDLDLIEANEAFAAQSLAVIRELGLPQDIVNVNGGAIALGHPIGASGARVLVTLLHEMKKRDVKRGLATLCIGGGMGVALCVERS